MLGTDKAIVAALDTMTPEEKEQAAKGEGFVAYDAACRNAAGHCQRNKVAIAAGIEWALHWGFDTGTKYSAWLADG
jgi:hypothetical protein